MSESITLRPSKQGIVHFLVSIMMLALMIVSYLGLGGRMVYRQNINATKYKVAPLPNIAPKYKVMPLPNIAPKYKVMPLPRYWTGKPFSVAQRVKEIISTPGMSGYYHLLKHYADSKQLMPLLYKENITQDRCQHSQYVGNLTYIPKGRMGNQLFMLFSAKYIAYVNKLNFVVPVQTIRYLSSVFNMNEFLNVSGHTRAEHKDDRKLTYDIYVEQPCRPDEELNFLHPCKNIKIFGFLQSYPLLINIIKSEYSLDIRTDLQQKADEFLVNNLRPMHPNFNDNIIRSKYTIIGIHWRSMQGPDNHLMFALNPAAYVKKAMEYYESKYNNIIYVMCSSNLKAISGYFVNSTRTIIFSNNSLGVDFALLTMSDHLIITVGTFGFWTGYLSKGEVVYFDYLEHVKQLCYIKMARLKPSKYPSRFKSMYANPQTDIKL